MSKTENHELILQELKDSPFQKVKVAIVDIDGVMRGKYMAKESSCQRMVVLVL